MYHYRADLVDVVVVRTVKSSPIQGVLHPVHIRQVARHMGHPWRLERVRNERRGRSQRPYLGLNVQDRLLL